MFQTAGYKTGCFGKWGLGDLGTDGEPHKQGFDEFFGYLHQVHAHWYYPEYLIKNSEKYPLKGNESGARTSYSHDAIAEHALDFIRRHKDQPFFCYVPFTIPHLELLVPEDSLEGVQRQSRREAVCHPQQALCRSAGVPGGVRCHGDANGSRFRAHP